MMRIQLALAALIGLAGVVAAAPVPRAARVEKIDASFETVAPHGWASERSAEGLRLSGPLDDNGLQTFIAIRYVAPNDKNYSNADAYVARQTRKPEFMRRGWKAGAVTPIVVAGRQSRKFSKDTVEFVPPASMNTREIPMREEHVVVPAEKGFYVLLYGAPQSLFDAHRSAFKAALAAFKPKY
jgi:hypothetical protein